MPTTERKLRVFLCHASQDKPAVRELYQRLLTEDWIDPWLDEEKLLPGQDWDLEIEKAVEAANAVIVCLSSNSVSKEGYIQRELKFVLDIALEKPEGTIFVIPLRLNDCDIPRRLRAWHYADYYPPQNRDNAFARLLISLQTRISPGSKLVGDVPIYQKGFGNLLADIFLVGTDLGKIIRKLADEHLPWPEKRQISTYALFSELVDHKIVPSAELENFKKFWAVHNKMTHTADFDISSKEAKKTINIGLALLEQLKNLTGK